MCANSRRRAGINDDVKLFHWADFDPGRRSHALGLQQNVDESHEDFMSRVEATARTKGSRVAFVDNIRDGGLTVIQAPLGS